MGGGLTDGSKGKIEGEIRGQDRDEDSVSTESGDLTVVISQKTGPSNEINLICEFEDFYEDELVVKVPKGSYAFGVDTEVSTNVSLVYNGKKVEVKGKGKVIEVESLNEQRETLIISLAEIDEAKYQTFMSLYEDRQQSIMDFMKLAKGY